MFESCPVIRITVWCLTRFGGRLQRAGFALGFVPMPDPLTPPRRFFVADLNVKGELRAEVEYRYEQLEQVPGAPDLISAFSAAVWRSPEEFDVPLRAGNSRLTLRWRAAAPTAGIATVRNGEELATISLLCSGLDENADSVTLRAYQQHLLAELRDTGYEPAFGLMELRQRPVVATMTFFAPPDPTDQLLVALADRCFAAAFFRYLSLA